MAKEHPLKAWIEGKGESQTWLARKLEISDAYLSQLLSGQRTPSLGLAVKIEKLTGISARDMFAEVA